MTCLRCQGLMESLTLKDVDNPTNCLPGWRCLLCGEVMDAGIAENRHGHPDAVKNRARPPGTVPAGTGALKRKMPEACKKPEP
ncbi:MAG: hypothetical protein ACREI3_09075 [Nitrospirales bacterium]